MNTENEKIIKGIFQELKGGEKDLQRIGPKSLKFIITNIYSELSEYLKVNRSTRISESNQLTWSLTTLGIISILLSIMQADESDIEWIKQHSAAISIWGVALSTIFVAVSLERSSFFQSLWKFTSTKVILSAILSGVIAYARGKAAGLVNGVFHVDASVFPITFGITTGLVVFKMLVPFAMALAAAAGLAHILTGLAWLKNRKSESYSWEPAPLFSMLFICVSFVIIYYGSSWSNGQLSDRKVPEKIFLLAHALDFSYSHECINVDPQKPVIFLGPSQESVLVAPYGLEDFNFGTFYEASVDLPSRYGHEKCEYREQK